MIDTPKSVKSRLEWHPGDGGRADHFDTAIGSLTRRQGEVQALRLLVLRRPDDA